MWRSLDTMQEYFIVSALLRMSFFKLLRDTLKAECETGFVSR